jgi:hypothetical protein
MALSVFNHCCLLPPQRRRRLIRSNYMTGVATFRKTVFGISPEETRFDRRGFSPAEPTVRKHLETAGRAFIDGYNTALADPKPEVLTGRLNKIATMFRGFAFEGAAMGLALLDLITPWNRRRFQQLLDSPAGDAHLYLLYVGAGWGIARVPWARGGFERTMTRYDRLYRWLALDGFGFHQGFFYTRNYVEGQATWPRLSHHAAQVFDQGLGRSMWFSHGGDPARLAASVAAFPADRRSDLWSGVGLGASYAGGVERDWLEELRERAGEYAAHLAQGAAFAAKARQRAGNLVPHTEMACDVFCRLPAAKAAAVTDDCLKELPADGAEPAYQVWRRRIREQLALRKEATSDERNAAQAPVPP